MKAFVPYEKMSKKQKREQDKKKRGTWTLSPVTRIADTDKKKYSRKIKHKNSGGDDSLPLFFGLSEQQPFQQRQIVRAEPAVCIQIARLPVRDAAFSGQIPAEHDRIRDGNRTVCVDIAAQRRIVCRFAAGVPDLRLRSLLIAEPDIIQCPAEPLSD